MAYKKNEITIISIYIDKFLLAAKHQKLLNWIKKNLKKEYKIKDLEKTRMIIKWQIIRNISSIKIDQLVFICNLVKDKSIQDCNPITTPIKASNFIKMQRENNYKKADLKIYQRLIGKLIYLSCGTKLDIFFIVKQFSKQNADPRMGHLKVAK